LNLLFQNLLKAQHVSSGMPLIIRSSKLYLNYIIYPCGDRLLSRLGGNSPTQPGQRRSGNAPVLVDPLEGTAFYRRRHLL